ncbi:hypothetical protein JOF53_004043 [Crossiella equi]|uniref:CU044_5270 family protein n=1 Tax=Crossiella equi TaxID=130796 RepID=A0ABS5AF18_9PSEU|nr:CU044_5270 family protein [Crossiella equi]MBP2475171.1 hypothetical protein [Crossiella equi]
MTERRVWSEDELDTALAGLHAEPASGPARLAAARAELLAAAGQPVLAPASRPRRQARRWLVAAAVVAAVATGALVVPWGGAAPTADAHGVLAAAAKGTDGDGPLRPGEFRYVQTRSWDAASAVSAEGKPYTYLEETLLEVWIPADENDEWVRRTRITGQRQWTIGVTEAEYRAAGLPIDEPGTVREERARRGEFSAELGGRTPGWHDPTQAWQDALPKDAKGIYDSLRRGRDDREAMGNALTALRSGRLRTEVRGLVYEALRLIPGIRVTDGALDLGGRHGVAIGLSDESFGEEAIVDPVTGRFLGERVVVHKASEYYPKGTVIQHSTVTTARAGQAGIAPTR